MASMHLGHVANHDPVSILLACKEKAYWFLVTGRKTLATIWHVCMSLEGIVTRKQPPGMERCLRVCMRTKKKMAKTFNSRYALMVTHLTTNPPVEGLTLSVENRRDPVYSFACGRMC